MPSTSWSLCCFWHHRPQHLNHSPLILVRYGSVLCWFKSYLSSCCLRVKCDNNLSSFYTFYTPSCVSQGSVISALYSLACTLYTTLSTLSSFLSLDHHLYADDTQLFFSFHPLNFDSGISHIQKALQHISFWVTAKLLTLNSSKTEFLLNGLKSQLDKIYNSSLDTSHPARNLGSIFDEHLTFSESLSKACYYHIRQLRCIRPYLDSSTACIYLYRSLQTWLL